MKTRNYDTTKLDIIYFAKSSTQVIILFALTYYTTNYIASTNTSSVCTLLDIDYNFPYLPYFYFIYYSVVIFPFFILKSSIAINAISRWKCQSISGIILSFIIHYMFPTLNCYHIDTQNLFEKITNILVGRYNMAPSLHVIMTTITAYTLLRFTKMNKLLVVIYSLLLCASTLFTHQHGVIDIFTGAAIGFSIIIMCPKYVPTPTGNLPRK